ncbi:MAG TPA: AzlC family ABC transporter permease [Trueperaceae bacterium]
MSARILTPSFAAGFRAILPLWVGVAPFGLAYAVSARAAGLSLLDTQLMSLTVFAGAAQFTAAGLFAGGASPLALILTTFIINVRHLLYSLTLGQRERLSWPQRFAAAQFLTDEAFGVVIAAAPAGGPIGIGFLLGAELSLYLVWNASTLAGSLLGGFLPDPEAIGLDVIFPLAFLALLVPLLRRPVDAGIAVFSGLAGLLAVRLMPSGIAILVVGILGALLGAWLTSNERASKASGTATLPRAERDS